MRIIYLTTMDQGMHDKQALTVKCPECGAEVGEPCIGLIIMKRGWRLGTHKPHKIRRLAGYRLRTIFSKLYNTSLGTR